MTDRTPTSERRSGGVDAPSEAAPAASDDRPFGDDGRWPWIHWRLDTYVLRRFLWLYGGTLLCFTLLYVLVDLFENLHDFDSKTEGFVELLSLCSRYYLAVVPAVFCQLLGPVVALTAGLFTVTLFQRANELVPMLANGLPFWRIVAPILACGGVVSVATFLVQEIWVPATSQVIKELSGLKGGKAVLRDQTYHDLEGGMLISMKRYDLVAQRARGVTVIDIPKHVKSDPNEFDSYVWAKKMRWVEPTLSERGYWLLEDGREQRYHPESGYLDPTTRGSSESSRLQLFSYFHHKTLETTLIPDDIEAQKENFLYIELDDLRRRKENSLDRRWAVKYYSRFASPLSALVLLFVGLPLVAYYGSRNIFIGALTSALIACSYIVLGSMTTNLALRGFLSAAIGPFLTPIAYLALGITWLRYLRH